MANQKQLDRWATAISKEAAGAGFIVGEVKTAHTDYQSTMASRAGAMFTGKLALTSLQSFELQGPSGQHVYLQPWSELGPTPGEYHGNIQGSLAAPVTVVPSWWAKRSALQLYTLLVMFSLGLVLLLGLRRPKIRSADPDTADRLKRDPKVRAALKALTNEWPVGTGRVSLDWLVQMRSNGDGTSSVTMAAGRYGGFTAYKVGMPAYQRLVGALAEVVEQTSHPAQTYEQNPRFEPAAA